MAKRAPKAKPPAKRAPAPAVDRDAIVHALFEHMHGGGSVRGFAESNRIPYSTLLSWANDEQYGDQYARAREVQADADVVRAVEIAEKAVNGEHDPQAARLLVDTLKWRASKFHRNRYGDKVDATISSPDGGPVQVEQVWTFGARKVVF